ncbi:phytanoyl-CoA dioxygenase family protein [Chitinibacter sp. GC72]|uniref:phytanoyl-CoA dioxygenase family protein n=1 Tax=Chitinibacter sp. GC72 TaxID=1526917 RepID=UPI0018DF5A34|nr:phytanoyl-CoA dioxygenase family protein [Chitinibacter sp. GC72]
MPRHRFEAFPISCTKLLIHRINTIFSRLVRDQRLLKIAEQIVGGETYIHQSRINYKPGLVGKEFYWHSDFETWHIEDGMPAMRAVSCAISLTDNNAFNGALMLIPGSQHFFISCVGKTPDNHYQTSLKKQEYGVPDPISLQFLVEKNGIEMPTGPAGSVVFFDCNTMHGSNSNISLYARSNVFMVYNHIDNQLQAPRDGLTPSPRAKTFRHSAHCHIGNSAKAPKSAPCSRIVNAVSAVFTVLLLTNTCSWPIMKPSNLLEI